MNKIVAKRQLSQNVFQMEVEAPDVARERKAGQFVIVMTDADSGARIPLTISDADPVRGTILLTVQAVGESTMKLVRIPEGESIAAVLGPLGRPTHIEAPAPGARRHAICVGGGIGVAPLHPIAQALKAAGNDVTVIMGARDKSLLIMEEEMRRITDDVTIVTDDGSAGRKGLVTAPLAEMCEKGGVDEVIAIGPPIMMKFVCLTTKPFGIKTTVSLNTIMIDGTGMCGGCRISIGGETKFVCVDGPEFDGHQVDWDQMLMRLRTFKSEEDAARNHACHALAAAGAR